MAILDASNLTTVSLAMDLSRGFHFCVLSSVKVCIIIIQYAESVTDIYACHQVASDSYSKQAELNSLILYKGNGVVSETIVLHLAHSFNVIMDSDFALILDIELQIVTDVIRIEKANFHTTLLHFCNQLMIQELQQPNDSRIQSITWSFILLRGTAKFRHY